MTDRFKIVKQRTLRKTRSRYLSAVRNALVRISGVKQQRVNGSDIIKPDLLETTCEILGDGENFMYDVIWCRLG